MKKLSFSIIAVVFCFSLLISCASTKEDTAIHVTTFTEFVDAFKLIKEDPTKDTIMLDNNIVWDFTLYSGGDYVFSPNATGLTIDLGGHTISEVPTNAFNLCGEAFTLKNGSILGSEKNSKYSVNINYDGTNGVKEAALPKVPSTYDESDPVWAKRIIVEDITATGMLCGYSTVEIKNSNFIGGQYRGLVLQGSSGIVENVTAITLDSAGSAGFVAHSYGTVLVKGNCTFKGKFGVYSAQCSTLSFAEGANVSIEAWATYGIYLEKQSLTTIGQGVTVQPAEGKEPIYARKGSLLIIEKGAVIKDGAGAEIAAPIATEYININDSVGESDSDWRGAGIAAEVQDNR